MRNCPAWNWWPVDADGALLTIGGTNGARILEVGAGSRHWPGAVGQPICWPTREVNSRSNYAKAKHIHTQYRRAAGCEDGLAVHLERRFVVHLRTDCLRQRSTGWSRRSTRAMPAMFPEYFVVCRGCRGHNEKCRVAEYFFERHPVSASVDGCQGRGIRRARSECDGSGWRRLRV